MYFTQVYVWFMNSYEKNEKINNAAPINNATKSNLDKTHSCTVTLCLFYFYHIVFFFTLSKNIDEFILMAIVQSYTIIYRHHHHQLHRHRMNAASQFLVCTLIVYVCMLCFSLSLAIWCGHSPRNCAMQYKTMK